MNTVLVTGGSKGIGSAIAEEFASLGYAVAINYNKSEEKAKALRINEKIQSTCGCLQG